MKRKKNQLKKSKFFFFGKAVCSDPCLLALLTIVKNLSSIFYTCCPLCDKKFSWQAASTKYQTSRGLSTCSPLHTKAWLQHSMFNDSKPTPSVKNPRHWQCTIVFMTLLFTMTDNTRITKWIYTRAISVLHIKATWYIQGTVPNLAKCSGSLI